jgi:organic hydroperoxide reductase OsmC/OhrA
MEFTHAYAVDAEWVGDLGSGTSDYRSYARRLVLRTADAPDLPASSDTPFRGDADRWNPEELLVGALAQCHMLSYLHVAATNGVVVTAYTDAATGEMVQTRDGGGHFTSVTLRPRVTIASGDPELAQRLHAEAASKCFIAASVNFPVHHEPEVVTA